MNSDETLRVGRHAYLRVESSQLPSGLRWYRRRHGSNLLEYCFAALGSVGTRKGAEWMRIYDRPTKVTSYWRRQQPVKPPAERKGTRPAKRPVPPRPGPGGPGSRREAVDADEPLVARLPVVQVSQAMLASLRLAASTEGVAVGVMVRRAIRLLLEDLA